MSKTKKRRCNDFNQESLKKIATPAINERDECMIDPMKTENYAADNLDIR